MPSFDDYIVYVDESGDHGLNEIDAEYPVFVLAFCLFRKAEYSATVVPSVLKIKFDFFGHDQIILHGRDIRKQRGPFRVLSDATMRDAFHARLKELVEGAQVTIIASVIDKNALKASYGAPGNPYALAMTFCLERTYLHLNGLGCSGGRLWLVFEERGHKEDNELELEFRRACASNATRQVLPFEILFAKKASNSSGLQLADLVAHPIGRHVLDPKSGNRAFDVVEMKLRRSSSGQVKNYGLKIFP